jgi:NUMOD3 motif
MMAMLASQTDRCTDMHRIFYVYVLFRPWDGSPCYVGKGKGHRWSDHERRGTNNKHLANIIAKAGGELPKVKVRQNLTEEEAFQTERAFIAALGRGRRGYLVNLTDGGEGWAGRHHSKKTREQIRDHHVVYFNDPVVKDRIIAATKAAMGTPKVSMAVKAAQKKRWSDSEERRKQAERRIGKPLSAEHRAAIGAAHLGQKRSIEARAKMSAWQVGRKMSAEARAKMSAAAKARVARQNQQDGV